jgi:hypothetical protein
VAEILAPCLEIFGCSTECLSELGEGDGFSPAINNAACTTVNSSHKGARFRYKDDHLRHNIRVRWWDQSATNFREAFLGPESARMHIRDDEITGDHYVEYSHDAPPIILGHYRMEGERALLTSNIACLDYM